MTLASVRLLHSLLRRGRTFLVVRSRQHALKYRDNANRKERAVGVRARARRISRLCAWLVAPTTRRRSVSEPASGGYSCASDSLENSRSEARDSLDDMALQAARQTTSSSSRANAMSSRRSCRETGRIPGFMRLREHPRLRVQSVIPPRTRRLSHPRPIRHPRPAAPVR